METGYSNRDEIDVSFEYSDDPEAKSEEAIEDIYTKYFGDIEE